MVVAYICPMNNKWLWHWRYFIFWIIYFIGAKSLFLIYQLSRTKTLVGIEIAKIYFYGLRLDIAFAAYLSIIPFFIFLLQAILPRISIYRFLHIYTCLFIILISFVTVLDLELYRAWGYRLDITPLQYLNTPREMMASAANAPVLLLSFLFLSFTLLSLYLYRLLFPRIILAPTKKLSYILLCAWYLIFLILPSRGGWQHIPVNQSNVYFSKNIFANHAAINVPWNILFSLVISNRQNENPYRYFPDATAQQYLADLYHSQTGIQVPIILKNRRPNLLFIILESYTGKLIGCLGGETGVTPHLDKLAAEGILFDSIYASGDRSEKGLVALLSSYPVQPFISIIKTPRKTEQLPHLNRVLQTAGYHSSYYYGGELAFANIKSYLVNAGYYNLTSKFDFKPSDYNSKWGVHDHVLLQRVLQDLKKEKEPFFSTVFTLSSHEPYDIPVKPKFAGTDEATKFKNSFYYTDEAIGKFVAAAKKEIWWQNTLVVLVADHGHRLPNNDQNDAPGKFRIPFILTGGALAIQNKVISQIGSQTDIVPTLLYQMNLPLPSFRWSKNLLDSSAKPFAFYVFSDGFGFITRQGAVTFDNVARNVIQQDTTISSSQLNYGKAYMQTSYEDYLKR